MERRALGRTNLMVTPLGLGLAALGRPGYINLGHRQDMGAHYEVEAMEAQAHAVLDAAWQAGIRYFDVARSYGRAEPFLASWLNSRGIARESVVVGSKWGYTYTAGWQVKAAQHEVKDHSLPVLRRQLQESRRFLGDYLRLYQIHSATLDSGVLEDEDVLAELHRLKMDGMYIGLSLSGVQQTATLQRALQLTVNGQLLFDAVQATWNLLEPAAGKALQQAKDRGMGVIVKEALANGRLTSRNEDPAFQPRLARLQQAAVERSTTVDALALAAALAQPWADVVLSGAAQVAHLQANVAARRLVWDEALAASLGDLAETSETYWRTRSQLAWN
ncbi:MAG: aldo/keto reductase [Candidatus Promineifilaceae bacterium]